MAYIALGIASPLLLSGLALRRTVSIESAISHHSVAINHSSEITMQTSLAIALAAALGFSVGICQAQTSTPTSNLRMVATDDAPKAAGPYSQGVVAGGFLFVAGMTPRDPKTGSQVADTFDAAANRVLENLEAVLRAEGLDWTDAVKTTVYLTKSEDFAPMNAVYAKRLGAGKPVRSTVIVSALPGGAILEMDVIARTRK